MKQLNKFLIRLQTFELKTLELSKPSTNGISNEVKSYYDLSHENPYLSIAFSKELKFLCEQALTDILTLPKEQVHFQIKRLKSIQELFDKFWEGFYTDIPRDIAQKNNNIWNNIYLPDFFIVHGIEKVAFHIKITDQFLDDIEDSVRAREEILEYFAETATNAICDDENDKSKVNSKVSEQTSIGKLTLGTELRPFNFSTDEAMMGFYDLIKAWFSDNDKSRLLKLLRSESSDNMQERLIFHGKGNQLADAFKQMFEGNLIVGCSKQVLQNWIAENFLFGDIGNPKAYNKKYLSDIISSTVRECQSPILNVRKTNNGYYGVFPVYRNKKNHNKQ